MSLNKNIIHTIISQIPILLFQFVSGVYLTRFLGPYYKGIHSLVTANLTVFSLFIGLSINTGLIYFISSKKIKVENLKAISYLILVFASIIGAFIIYIPNPLYNSLMPDTYNEYFFKTYLYVGFLLSIYSTIIQGFLQGKKEYPLINKILVIQASISAVAYIVLYYFPEANFLQTPLRTALLFSLIIQFLILITYFIPYKLKVKEKTSFNSALKRDLKQFFNFIGFGHVSNIINFFNYRIDLWFLNGYHSAEQVGYYSLAVNLSNLILFIATPISNVAFPYFSEANSKLKLTYLKLYSKLNSTIIIWGGILGGALGYIFIPIIYGEEFSPSLIPFEIMILASISMGINKLFSVYFSSNNQIKLNFYSTVIGLFITISSNILLIPTYGIIGASISSFLTYSAIMFYSYYKLPKNSTFENYFIMSIFDLKNYLKSLNKTNHKEQDD